MAAYYPAPIHAKLLDWFDQHGRKDLPWQQSKDPYGVWVSEIMLQQTQVTTVIAYYRRFMRSFATLEALAEASLDEVLHHWSGLGYYSRARNLHAAARQIVEQHAGVFPRDLDSLQALPGIGPSTAGAICAIAFNQPTSILDGNVKRVLTRLHALSGWPGKSAISKQLWQLAEHHTPDTRCADYTQAIMDLGATLCTRRNPACERCPIQDACLAFEQNLVSVLPTPKPRKSTPQKYCAMMVIEVQQQVLLIQRPNYGLWGGLWCLPQIDLTKDDNPEAVVAKWCAEYLQAAPHVEPATPKERVKLKHSFSHYQLHITAFYLSLTRLSEQTYTAQLAQGRDHLWYKLSEPQAVGTAVVVEKLLASLSKKL